MGFETQGVPGKPNLLDCLRAAVRLHKQGGVVAAVRSGDDNDRDAATRSSLIKLAKASIDLHARGVEAGILPRTADERSKPLLVALTALATIRNDEGV
jgi:hypothetical protein